MGMTIDKSTRILVDRYIDTYVICGGANYNPSINITREDREAFQVAIDTMRKYQQMQAEYETRLKADMVAILTEIQLEIEELKPNNPNFKGYYEQKVALNKASDVIQQKIDKLKGRKDG